LIPSIEVGVRESLDDDIVVLRVICVKDKEREKFRRVSELDSQIICPSDIGLADIHWDIPPARRT
jgi:hypothetical protein